LFLLAALESALERADIGDDSYHRGSLTVRRSARAADWKSKPLVLTLTEFRIVDCLASQDGVAHPYEKLRLAAQIQEVSDMDIDFRNEDEKRREKTKALRATLHTHVRCIRAKLEIADKAAKIESGDHDPPLDAKTVLVTEHDFGYRLRRSSEPVRCCLSKVDPPGFTIPPGIARSDVREGGTYGDRGSDGFDQPV